MMNNPSILIEAKRLRKSFGAYVAIDDVSLRVIAGEVMTILGPNGSGKTTLLKLLLGLETPDSGTIHRCEGLTVGYMPQKVAIDPVIPVTVGWFLRLFATSKRDDIASVAAEVGIEALMQRSMQALSGGEMQRVMLARALLANPKLLVLDEPVQGVDVNGQALLYDLIAAISRRRGCAVLMVSHDLHLVMSATDEVLCLNRHVCCVGHPHKVSGDPAFTALFGDHAARALAVYTHHHNHFHDHDGHEGLSHEDCTHEH